MYICVSCMYVCMYVCTFTVFEEHDMTSLLALVFEDVFVPGIMYDALKAHRYVG
jgi:hypothetical protein